MTPRRISPAIIQARHREVGRIRMGFQQEYQKDGVTKYRAAKLKTFRVTSTSEATVHAVAAVYGGQVQAWDTAPAGTGRQWQVVVESPFLDFLIIPDGFSSSFEMWGGGGCLRRCDGFQEEISGGACLCNPEKRECKPTSRLQGFLPLVEVVGSFRLESHGENAARELAAFADLMAAAELSGFRTPIRLRIEERSSKVEGQPRHDYIVPVPEIVGLTPQQMLGSGRAEPMAAIPSGIPALPRGDRLVRDAHDDAVEGFVVDDDLEDVLDVARQEWSKEVDGMMPGNPAERSGMSLEEIQAIAKEQNVSVAMLNAQAKLIEPTGRTLPVISPQERLDLAQRLLGV